VFFFEVAGSLT